MAQSSLACRTLLEIAERSWSASPRVGRWGVKAEPEDPFYPMSSRELEKGMGSAVGEARYYYKLTSHSL
jgi:hypothetical protein